MIAVGLLMRQGCRRPVNASLLTSRPQGKGLCRLLGVPGAGKFEAGETRPRPCAVSLQEEIGVVIGEVHPWKVDLMDYPPCQGAPAFSQGPRVARRDPHAGVTQHMVWESLPVVSAPVLPGTVPVLQWLAQEWGSRDRPTSRCMIPAARRAND